MAMTDDLRAAIKRSGLSANEIGRRAKLAASVVSRFVAETGKTKTASLSLVNAEKIGAVVGWPAPSAATLVKTRFTHVSIRPIVHEGRTLVDGKGNPYYEVVPGTESRAWRHPIADEQLRAALAGIAADH